VSVLSAVGLDAVRAPAPGLGHPVTIPQAQASSLATAPNSLLLACFLDHEIHQNVTDFWCLEVP
jgi:hypothetical protein